MTLSLEEFRAKALSLHDEKRYAEALDYVTREGARFPAEQPRFRFFQLTMAALMGGVDQAIQFLQTALDEGQWYMERELRGERLAALQGQLAYERLVAICVERHEAAQAKARPLCLTSKPKPMPNPVPLLLVLHGNNSNGSESQPQWQSATAAGYLLAVAQSSQVEGPEMFVWNDEAKTTQEALQHLANLKRSHPVDQGRLVVGGFSMGGGEAIRLAVSGLIPARGFIVVGPYFRELAALTAKIGQMQPDSLRGYIITGDKDFSYQASREAARAFKQAGIAVEVEEHPGLGHAFPGGFDQSLKRALEFVEG